MNHIYSRNCQLLVFLLITIQMVLGIGEPIVSDEEWQNLCKDKGDMVYERMPGECNRFYICVETFPVILDCPERLYFDPVQVVCGTPDVIDCIPDRSKDMPGPGQFYTTSTTSTTTTTSTTSTTRKPSTNIWTTTPIPENVDNTVDTEESRVNVQTNRHPSERTPESTTLQFLTKDGTLVECCRFNYFSRELKCWDC